MDLPTQNKDDYLISEFYRAAGRKSIVDYPRWALNTLRQALPFDGALWASGHLSTMQIHSQTAVDISPDLSQQLLDSMAQNPLSEPLLERLGEPVDMSEVIDDDDFYASALYKQHFSQHGIERILSSIHSNGRSGEFTLLTLYRFDREHRFTGEERRLQKRILYHLLTAHSHVCFLQLEQVYDRTGQAYALCDNHGFYRHTQPSFLDLIEHYVETTVSHQVPFDIKKSTQQQSGLLITSEPLGDLYLVSLRPVEPLDQLTPRERQVVHGICSGLSFKAVANQLDLSTSTVSNHLYRVYQKLAITSRTELAKMIADGQHMHA